MQWNSAEGGSVTGGHAFSDEAQIRTLSFLNSRWDGAPIDRARSTEDYVRAAGRRLSTGLMLQPAVFTKFTEKANGIVRGIGSMARNLVCWPRSTMGTRFVDPDGPPIHLKALDRFTDRAEELYRLPLPMKFDTATLQAGLEDDGSHAHDQLELNPTELPLGPEARRLWIGYLNETEQELAPAGEMADVRDVAAKSAENACRLGAIFHTWQFGPTGTVGKVDMQRGIEVARWYLYEVRRRFSAPPLTGPRSRTPKRWRCGSRVATRRRARGISPVAAPIACGRGFAVRPRSRCWSSGTGSGSRTGSHVDLAPQPE